MTPDLVYRTKQHVDVEDLACQYLEDEVGRHDFRNNWAAVKKAGNIRLKIARWLDSLAVEAEPDAIIEYLDRLVAERAGNWR